MNAVLNLTQHWPLLTLMIASLPFGAAMIWISPARYARWIALITVLLDLVLAVLVLLHFDASQSEFQLVEQASWITTLNVQYIVGVDGISVLFLPLTAILFISVILSSWHRVTNMPRLYYALLLLLESTTLGVFCALDTILFFFFWELTLIPLYFLVSFWGLGAKRRFAAVNYTLFMLVGGVPLLFGFLLLAFNHADVSGAVVPAGLSFSYLTLLQTPVDSHLQIAVFLLLLAGFAFKTPIVPLHTWLPLTLTEGPVAIAALLVGLKVGVYGLIRFVVPLAPEAAHELHWLLAAMGVIGILYGALAAMAQTNLRRMLAFSSISHVGLVVLGIASLNTEGIQGALFQLINFTIIAGGLMLLTGSLHHRVGSSDIANLGGAARSMPMLASFYLLFGLAAMGLPGTSGFPAELLIIISALKSHTGAGLTALVAMVLSATYFFRLYRRSFMGPVNSPVIANAMDLLPREKLMMLIMVPLILLAGFYPAIVLDTIAAATDAWVGRLPLSE